MRDFPPQPSGDDPRENVEFEVSSLRPPRVSASSLAQEALRWLATWRRPLGAALAIALIALLVGGVLRSAHLILRGPTIHSPADDTVYLEYGVTWGVLRVNGRVIIDASQRLATQRPLILQPGANQIGYTAPPFAPLRCVLSVPPAQDDTCPLITKFQPEGDIQSSWQGRIINLGDTLARLPHKQLDALTQAATRALASPAEQSTAGSFYSDVILAPGDHYLTPHGQVATATELTRATLRFTLDHAISPHTAPGSNSPCIVLCILNPTGQLAVWVAAQWNYQPLTGDISSWQGAIFPPDMAWNSPWLLPIEITWSGGWRVFVTWYDLAGTTSSFCDVAGSQLNALYEIQAQDTYGVGDAEGCAYTGIPVDQQAPGGPPYAIFLFRCGVLLAVNSQARQLTPQLPSASATEAQAAQRLLGEIST